ncbi:hypothetical protein WG68_06535 [Arsukibacterium ikkense]|uniref:Uncharacterized protein n=1 Tax=Arsukibacterium ikkense TaxID=336831 RepID=A0A0M2V705_9GAMM|nr:hypothetical protein [Arsukibacterium ikkense]KKO46416.1 hypothetical protein WG68_06535 [Arsukibacterium ikkense]
MKNLNEMNRKKVLLNLLEYSDSLEDIMLSLRDYSWDFEGESIVIHKKHVLNAINLFMNGSISKEDLERWANLIECREDLISDEADAFIIDKIIYQLANPVLEGDINYEKCKLQIKMLDD